MTRQAIKFLDTTCSDKQGAKCAACEKTYTIWYVESIQIGRVYCKCESAPVGANRLGVLPYTAQVAS